MTNQNNEKSKNGKRLALILIAILLLVAIAFGAYTYSRYVTQDSGNGSATVARWGYEIDITGSSENNGFSKYYRVNNDTSAVAAGDNTGAVIAVVSSDGNIVAPGATGSVTFSVNGYAEVTAELVASLTNTSSISLSISGNSQSYTYYPVQYQLTKGTGESAEVLVDWGTIGTISTYFSTTKNPLSNYYMSSNVSETYTITWRWQFEGGNYSVPGSTTISANAMDTILGQIAASGNTNYDGYSLVDSSSNTWTVTGANITESFTLNVFVQQNQTANPSN